MKKSQVVTLRRFHDGLQKLNEDVKNVFYVFFLFFYQVSSVSFMDI